MRRALSFFLLLLLISDPCFLNSGKADNWENLSSGDQAAQGFLKQLQGRKLDAGSHPFYQGNAKESTYKDTELKGKAQTALMKDSAAQMVYHSHDTRPQIKIDPFKDPLLTGSNQVMKEPLEVIGGKGTQVVEIKQAGKLETINCEEAGDDSLETCTRDLFVTVEKVKERKEKQATVHLTGCKKSHKHYHTRSCPNLLTHILQWKPTKRNPKKSTQVIDVTTAFKECLEEVVSECSTRCYRCQNPRTTIPTDVKKETIKQVIIERDSTYQPLISGNRHYSKHGRLKTYDLYANIKILYEEDAYRVLPDEWSDNCARLEAQVDQGLCGYHSKKCTQGKETRTINGVDITRECWQQTMTYACSYPAKDDCGPLRARGCAQIQSQCKQYVGNVCVLYGQTYQCKDSPRNLLSIAGGDTPFCMDGNCRDQSWENNDEMMSSVAQLSILKEMQGNFKNGFLFKGDDNRCSTTTLSFKDCCGSGKGWGNDVGLASCSSKEKLLNKRRKEGLCHRVGTYCAEKVLNKCVKKKTSFCCFSSKLLKAFHEQGRAQIKMGWGKPKHPLCRGFTIEEIQKIDFSKLDLREVFEDLMKNYKPGKMGDIAKQVGERLEVIKKGVVTGAKQPQIQQRKGGA